MKAFEYIAADAGGSLVAGTAWAASESDLDHTLEGRGLLLTRAKVVGDSRSGRGIRVRRNELINLTNQLATVTGAGVPIVEGLAGIGARLETRAGRQLVTEMVSTLRTGESLSRVVEAYPRTFSTVYRATILAGEASGALDKVLTRLAGHLDWIRRMRSTTIQALIYPALLVVAIVGLILILLYFLLPRIIGMYPGGVEDLPVQTRIVVGLSNFVRGNVVWLVLGLGAAAAGFAGLRRSVRGRRVLDGLLLRIPKLGSVAKELATSKFACTASILHSAGCDVFTVLDVAASTCGNAFLRHGFDRAAERVRRGETISDALEKEPLVDTLLVQMVSVGERTGSLDGCLAKLVEHYDDEIPRRVHRFLSLLEPLILVTAGIVVAFILLASLLPIFELYERIS
ncbi:MAG: type II secretion system F family protein [Planctomycetota bacterium]